MIRPKHSLLFPLPCWRLWQNCHFRHNLPNSPTFSLFLPFLVVACISGHISDVFGGSVTLQAHTEPDVRRASSCWGSNNFLGLLNILQCCFHLLIFINK